MMNENEKNVLDFTNELSELVNKYINVNLFDININKVLFELKTNKILYTYNNGIFKEIKTVFTDYKSYLNNIFKYVKKVTVETKLSILVMKDFSNYNELAKCYKFNTLKKATNIFSKEENIVNSTLYSYKLDNNDDDDDETCDFTINTLFSLINSYIDYISDFFKEFYN